MGKEHTYQVTAWWASGRTGIAKSNSAPNTLHFAAPPHFGGVEGRWTPEDLLLSAVASCFTTTFQSIAQHAKVEYLDLEVIVKGMVSETTMGYRFTGIMVEPILTIADESGQTIALELLHKTKALCLVSRALGTAQEFVPRVEIRKAVPLHRTSALPNH